MPSNASLPVHQNARSRPPSFLGKCSGRVRLLRCPRRRVCGTSSASLHHGSSHHILRHDGYSSHNCWYQQQLCCRSLQRSPRPSLLGCTQACSRRVSGFEQPAAASATIADLILVSSMGHQHRFSRIRNTCQRHLLHPGIFRPPFP